MVGLAEENSDAALAGAKTQSRDDDVALAWAKTQARGDGVALAWAKIQAHGDDGDAAALEWTARLCLGLFPVGTVVQQRFERRQGNVVGFVLCSRWSARRARSR